MIDLKRHIQQYLNLRKGKIKQRVQYVQGNIFKKLFFKRKFCAFSHLKQIQDFNNGEIILNIKLKKVKIKIN